MKTVLAQIDDVIGSLEDKGLYAQANKLHKVFIRVAQARPTYTTKAKDTYNSIAQSLMASLGVSDWRVVANKIKELNGIPSNDNIIYQGSVLKLPIKADFQSKGLLDTISDAATGLYKKVFPPTEMVDVTNPGLGSYWEIGKVIGVNGNELSTMNGGMTLQPWSKIKVPKNSNWAKLQQMNKMAPKK